MGRKEEYPRRKERLLTDKKICEANRKLFKKFFEQEEYKLKRRNGIKELDESCYKTLCGYVAYLRNVNLWFKNKEWKKLTKAEIKKVYDDLEDQKLKGSSGKIITGRSDYYEKIFKSLPFELAGKDKIAREVMKYYNNNHRNEDVRFFEEDTFRKIANATETINQRLLCWIAWDIGENIFSLLQLQKMDFVRNINSKTKDPEYIVNLPKEKIKRSRRTRSEITNYRETTELLDSVLPEMKKDEDYLFNFGHRNALKFLDKAVRKVQAVCIPKGHKVTWKDFRSSMSCHLLKVGYTSDEIKSRLGHSPSSRAIDKYANYLSIGKERPKVKVQEGEIEQLQEGLEKMKHREKLQEIRNETQNKELEELKKEQEKAFKMSAHVEKELAIVLNSSKLVLQNLALLSEGKKPKEIPNELRKLLIPSKKSAQILEGIKII